VNPGPNFGPYDYEAAALFWSGNMRWNMGPMESSNASMRSHPLGLLTPDMIRRGQGAECERAGLHAGNLLKREVNAEDVAQAFVHMRWR